MDDNLVGFEWFKTERRQKAQALLRERHKHLFCHHWLESISIFRSQIYSWASGFRKNWYNKSRTMRWLYFAQRNFFAGVPSSARPSVWSAIMGINFGRKVGFPYLWIKNPPTQRSMAGASLFRRTCARSTRLGFDNRWPHAVSFAWVFRGFLYRLFYFHVDQIRRTGNCGQSGIFRLWRSFGWNHACLFEGFPSSGCVEKGQMNLQYIHACHV